MWAIVAVIITIIGLLSYSILSLVYPLGGMELEDMEIEDEVSDRSKTIGGMETGKSTCGCIGGCDKCKKSAIPPVLGSSELKTEDIVHSLSEYIKETGTKNLEEYLIGYFSLKDIDAEIAKNPSSVPPESLRRLYAIIDKIKYNNFFSDKADFIKRANLQYIHFVDPDKQLLLLNAPKIVSFSSSDVDEVAKILDTYLDAEKVTFERAKVHEKAKEFLASNMIFKFKKDKAEMSADKIKSIEPSKVYEIDTIGLIPRIRDLAKQMKEERSSNKLMEQIKSDLDRLNLNRYYSWDYTRAKNLMELSELLRNAKENKVDDLDRKLREERRLREELERKVSDERLRESLRLAETERRLRDTERKLREDVERKIKDSLSSEIPTPPPMPDYSDEERRLIDEGNYIKPEDLSKLSPEDRKEILDLVSKGEFAIGGTVSNYLRQKSLGMVGSFEQYYKSIA